jgi:uncharacterized protein YbjT (DUF2867 family)
MEVSQENRSSWDLGRFLQTLSYFEIIPVISCLQRLWQRSSATSSKNQEKSNNMGVILVVGATGGVGKRVVRRLREENYRIRALVRDEKRARTILGDVELFVGDITRPETLTAQLMERVTAIISCTGTRVQPVEGDTPNRDKYYQGVKFYFPEVVDSPEQVEYEGIKNLLKVAVDSKGLRAGTRVLFDFQNPSQDLKATWGAVDDVVMGGVSTSNIRLVRDVAVFSGNVSTANNGGFASVRTRNFSPAWDLSGYEGLELRVRGDGKRYKLITRCEGKWDGVGYCYSFDTVHNFWTTIQVPFSALIPVFRAKTVPQEGAFDPSRVYSMQLMLSKFEYDGALNPKFEAGLFGLEVDYIKAYGGKPTPQVILISSAGVTRPGRPGLNLAEEPPAVRMNDQLGGILTWKLRGEDVVRESGLSYTIIRPCALTEKPAEQVLEVAQGDNIKGQVSRESIAELCLQVLENIDACTKTFEVRETAVKGKTNWTALLNQLSMDKQAINR